MKRMFLYILALAGVVIFLIPLVWTISTALKTRQQIFDTPPTWIPIAYRAADSSGVMQPVTVVRKLTAPAAEVLLLAGPQAGQTIAVDQAALGIREQRAFVKLRAADPIDAEVINRFPEGLAIVRFPGAPSNVFLPLPALQSHFAPQWRNFGAAWNSLPLPFHWFLLNTYTITMLNV